VAEYHLINTSLENKYYVKIYLDNTSNFEERSLYGSSLYKLSIIETMMSATPYVTLKFFDATGDLSTNAVIIPDDIWNIEFGQSDDSFLKTSFKFSTLEFVNNNKTNTDNIMVVSNMISNNWEGLFKNTYNRSWSAKKYSEIIKEIATEIGFTKFDIEETKEEYTVIQPNWTNNQLFKWISSNSVNKNEIGGYVYYIKLDGTFVFKTYDSIFNQKPSIEFFNNSVQKDEEKAFNAIGIKNNYMPTLIQGGFGIKYDYFDFESKTFVTGESTVDSFSERQLSDWYYISNNHNEGSKNFWGGRNIKTKNVVNNKIINSANSVHKTEIFVKGNINLSVGSIINLKISYYSSSLGKSGINETYSGYWLIWKIAHLFDSDSKSFDSHLFLSRNGVNGIDVKGLVKTTKGKELK